MTARSRATTGSRDHRRVFGAGRSVAHAEWTKLRTTPGLIRLLVTAAAVTAAIGVLAILNSGCPRTDCGVAMAFTGVRAGQAVVAIAGVLIIGDEYRTGMIRVTLAATPRRVHVLIGKIVVLAAAVTPAAVAGVTGALLPVHDHPGVLRAAVGAVLYLVLIALLSLGVATMLRGPAAAIGTVLGLLYVLPVVAAAMPDERWERRLQRISPDAALAVADTGDLARLAVLVWWVTAVLAVAALLLRRRDA
ncbi:ABC transporter [Actinoplanes lobatus]|uniref:ABC transporter n=1 Tax=Actinoplanes lobatus TaxID=113568 RepID=A0A7W7HJ90_9ACTN|nr:ABC transporter permease [Actinoplanes lobatus]MBB4751544.1 ABC-2 type transport system permease protein [Actinoplanes lobatus]GGN64605.1 ABC transporter [Actinoplanes lobatus]GIE45951.1 ABC transporter [Actinoplanes lobatus]